MNAAVPQAFIPYSRQHITEDDIAAVTAVLRSEFLTRAPNCRASRLPLPGCTR